MQLTFAAKSPKIESSVFIAPSAQLIGNIFIGAQSSVWFGAVIRGDSEQILIGSRTNIQDLSVLHVDSEHSLKIGDDVSVGHRALLHGCTVGDRVLIGMGAIIMNGAKIGEDSLIGAGALITENTVVPPRSLVLGMPAKVKKELSQEEIASISSNAAHYVNLASHYIEQKI